MEHERKTKIFLDMGRIDIDNALAVEAGGVRDLHPRAIFFLTVDDA